MNTKPIIVRSVAWALLAVCVAIFALSWSDGFVVFLTANKAEHYGRVMAGAFVIRDNITIARWDKDMVEAKMGDTFLPQSSMRDVRVNPYVDSVGWGYDSDEHLHIFVHRRASKRAPVDTVLEETLEVPVAPTLSHRFDGPAGYMHYVTEYRTPIPGSRQKIKEYLMAEGSLIGTYATYEHTRNVVLNWGTNHFVRVFDSSRHEIRRNSAFGVTCLLMFLIWDALLLYMAARKMKNRCNASRLLALYWRGATDMSLRRLILKQSRKENLAMIADYAEASRRQALRRNLRDKVVELESFLDSNGVMELIVTDRLAEAEDQIRQAELARMKKRREDHLLAEAGKLGQDAENGMNALLSQPAVERQISPDQLLQQFRQLASLRGRCNALDKAFQDDISAQLVTLKQAAGTRKFDSAARRLAYRLEGAEIKQAEHHRSIRAATRRRRARA